MSNNTALVTDASKEAANKTLSDYANGVNAHIVGDWAGHNQARIHQVLFLEPVTSHQVSNYALRLGLTNTGTAKVVIIPALASSQPPAAGAPPTIVTQPASLSIYVGATATFTVLAASVETITYQWRKNGTNISGATANTLSIPNAQTTDQAAYSVVVSNVNGSVTSNDATLTVTVAPATPTPPPVDEGGGGGGCFKAGTRITRANGFKVPIEQVTVGSALRSIAIEGLDPSKENAYQTWKANQLVTKPVSTTVAHVIRNTFSHYFIINGSLSVTYEHPLLAWRGGVWQFITVANLLVGDVVYRNGSHVPVNSIVRVDKPIETWNLDVEPYDVYFADDFAVHNVTYKT